jgi:transcriptional regulator with XRE-family HTH domain
MNDSTNTPNDRHHGSSSGDAEREQALHRFVRERRKQLAPESTFLGERPRLPFRVGKRVTQEEFAEYLGISRGWYARFEAGAPAAFSLRLLTRLGDMLCLCEAERAELLRLALPELAPVAPRDATNLYDALGDIRRAVKRLWSATSEAEIFQLVGEEARRLLPQPELIWVGRGLLHEDAVFLRPGLNAGEWRARHESARSDLRRRLTPEQQARFCTLWQRTAAGDLQPFKAYPSDIAGKMHDVFREHGVPLESMLAAHIRGSSGCTDGLVGCESMGPRGLTQFERTMLSTIAGFASLALR